MDIYDDVKEHVRAKIKLGNEDDVRDFIVTLCDGTMNKYMVENRDCSERVNARSLLGMLYASSSFDETYLVNITDDGSFPSGIDKWR